MASDEIGSVINAEKNRFSTNKSISQMTEDRHIVTMEDKQEVAYT